MYRTLHVCLFLSFLLSSPAEAAPPTGAFDVIVYGATPGGIAAAIALGRGHPELRVALITRYRRVGGLITNGLTHPDFRTFEARTALFREMNQRVEKHYRQKYGDDSQEVKESLLGTHAGPELNHTVFREMLAECPGVSILTRHSLQAVQVRDRRIVAATFVDLAAETQLTLASRYFIDATYEGDLMAAANVPFRVGREGRDEYGESLAPDSPDSQLQGYNFRLTMTDRKENFAPVPKPEGYRREDFLELLPLLRPGMIDRVFGDPFTNLDRGIYKRQTPTLPEGKRDINDISRSIVRLSLPGRNRDWPTGDSATRRAIFAEHLRHNVGMLYFLQNDEAVPEAYRIDAKKYGLCRDEYLDNQHLPEQLYVREARRMVGRYVFTQRDTDRAPGSNHARAVFQRDAIAMGDYGPNCHGTDHEGPRFGGKHTGEFYRGVAPYQIPYGVILPNELENLAVPIACSASHVGFCALRLEPIWMSLGQAAGEAVGLALGANLALADIPAASIRQRLHATRTATIYVADVPEESGDFAAVQWWGGCGGFVPLDRTAEQQPAKFGLRGAQRIGQYYVAFPDHAVELDRPLDLALRTSWLDLARNLNLPTQHIGKESTRGDFIRRAWSQAKEHR